MQTRLSHAFAFIAHLVIDSELVMIYVCVNDFIATK